MKPIEETSYFHVSVWRSRWWLIYNCLMAGLQAGLAGGSLYSGHWTGLFNLAAMCLNIWFAIRCIRVKRALIQSADKRIQHLLSVFYYGDNSRNTQD